MDSNKEEMLRRIRESAAQDPETQRRMDAMRGLLDSTTSIAGIVAAYRAGCMPPNASAEQIIQTEQAQYAACQMLMKRLLDRLEEGGDAPNQWINAILAEIDQYASQRIAVVMGRSGGNA